MIQVAPQMRILVAIEPADFRCGIDGLAKRAREALAHDTTSGCLFMFRHRKATAAKILVYDGQGFWLCYKRLSTGRFRSWPSGQRLRALEAHELQVLLSAGDFEAVAAAPPWRRLHAADS